MNYQQAKEKLAQFGQEHVLQYFDVLSKEEQDALLKQVEETDFSILKALEESKAPKAKGKYEPLAAMELAEINSQRTKFEKIGLDAIRAGKVAAVLMAGGMGTRLGSDDPKGMYNIGITKTVYIFQRLVENLMDVVHAAGAWIPFFIMTSEKNHEATVRFLREKNYFGYKSEYVFFFKQEMAPATDYEGKIYLEGKNRMATSPNGNGGWFISMKNAGMVAKAQEFGVEWLNCFAVDNVLQRIADPVFVGATIDSGKACGAKVVKKAAPDEKVGVVCLEDGHPSVIEYYELTDELMNTLNEKGERAYNFGVILNYLFRVSDLNAMVEKKLPLHVVEKKIPCLDANGELFKPETPNGYKFESLILDMVYEMESCLPYEVVREKEFAPIKNKTGVDSVESARELCKKNGIVL